VSEPTPEALRVAEIEQMRAAELLDKIGSDLRRAGWDFVAIVVSRCQFDESTGHVLAPGATFYSASERMMPALPREADNLRMVAGLCDEAFRKSGCREATEASTEDVTARFVP
jgi:hypothetical protein